MSYQVYVKNYSAPSVNKNEILRYAGVLENTSEIDALLNECLIELENKLSYKVCYAEFPLAIDGDSVDLTFTKVTSKNLAKNLQKSNRFIVFVATIGVEIDRLILKYGAISPSKALIFQAIGAERVESLCNLFNNEVKKKYKKTKARFSAGYGDFPLEVQSKIFSALSTAKNIGVFLNDSYLMSPSKSVSAIIGVE